MISCSIASFIACSWFIASSLNVSHVFSNLIHVHWANCMFVKFIICQIRDWMTRMFSYWQFCVCFQFSIEINCSNSLFDLRFDWNRILVIKDSYEYIESFILIINNKIDWFFRFDVIDTIYDKEILHREMSKSNFVDIFICFR